MKQLFRSFFIFFAGVTFLVKPLVLPLRKAQAAEVKEIMVEGVGVIIQDDQSMARDRAIEDALRKAVEQAVGSLVESETRVRNYQILSDDIYSRSSGYIQSYQIVNESLSQNILKVTIRAVVSIGNLSEDLKAVGILLKRLDKPRVMVLIEEKNDALNEDTFLHQAEDTLIQMLSEKNFSFVDRKVIYQMSGEEKAMLAQSENIKAATSFGIQQGAEILIIGEAVVKKTKKSLSKMLGPMGSYRATVSLRAIKTDTGALLALANGTGVAVHINPLTGGNEAVKQAARRASEQLMNGLINRLNKEVGSVLSVQLVIAGLNDQLLVDLKNDLKSRIRGVQDIQQRFFGDGVANLDVEIKGTAQMLADELTRKKFFKYNLSMVSYSPNRIELQLIPKDSLP